MNAEESFGAFGCDTGSGRLGETQQHSEVEEDAPMLLGTVPAIPSIIAAIFGQCGSLGCPELLEPCSQQSTIATAGETRRPSSRDKATSLERIFTANTDLILYSHIKYRCDLDHRQMWS